jgi:DNA mismatch repair protein MutL
MSQKIITLPKQLANQIAAGEVVERPVSVVKELVENSLDAGASSVDIRLENGWIDLIEVRDDGLGIPTEDLQKALEKYSTSKISSLDDLYKVMTFGFRWEALASISSVSEFTIRSRTKNCQNAKEIFTAWWDDFEQSDVAHNIGTTILVEKLFFNTPARLSYLKKPRTEYLKVQEFIQKISLAYPDVAFSVQHDNKTTLSFPKKQGVEGRIYDIFWDEFSQNMLAVSHSFWGIQISGFITDPKISFQNKTRQALYVNKRVIGSPMIFKAISDAYNRFIAPKTFPGYVLFIDVDPTQVDVNVHPRKMEVRFAGEANIFRSVYHGVKDELERVSLVTSSYELPSSPYSWIPSPLREKETTSSKESEWGIQGQYYTGSGTKFKNYSPYKNTNSNPAQAGMDFNREIMWWKDARVSLPLQDLHNTPLGKIIGQIHNSYIIVETPRGVQMLDQHALAERVIYERLASSAYTPKVQQLLWGIGMHLTSSELEVFETNSENFSDMGFEIDTLSVGNIMISAVPDFVKKQNIEKVMREILSDISWVWSKGFDEVRHKIWAYAACRSAVKFWDPLSIFEMHALLRDASLDYSATCPHGRPVVYDIELDELQKKYER